VLHNKTTTKQKQQQEHAKINSTVSYLQEQPV